MKQTLTLITLIPFYFPFLSIIHILRRRHAQKRTNGKTQQLNIFSEVQPHLPKPFFL